MYTYIHTYIKEPERVILCKVGGRSGRWGRGGAREGEGVQGRGCSKSYLSKGKESKVGERVRIMAGECVERGRSVR